MAEVYSFSYVVMNAVADINNDDAITTLQNRLTLLSKDDKLNNAESINLIQQCGDKDQKATMKKLLLEIYMDHMKRKTNQTRSNPMSNMWETSSDDDNYKVNLNSTTVN